MTTKEFIKMLQDEDPEGNTHIRINGRECSFIAITKPGYWDGPYSYLEGKWGKDMTWVQSTHGNKIDIDCVDLYWFIEYFNGDYEKVKEHIKVEYDYCDKRHEQEFLNDVKKLCDRYLEALEKINKFYPEKD
jgi:hypothetical protein